MQIFPLCWHINHDKWSHFYSICKSSEAMNGIEIFFFEHCLKKWKITYNWMIYSICKSKSFCSFIALRGPSVQWGHILRKNFCTNWLKALRIWSDPEREKMFHSKLGQKEKVIFMLSCICRITSLLCWLKFEHMSLLYKWPNFSAIV